MKIFHDLWAGIRRVGDSSRVSNVAGIRHWVFLKFRLRTGPDWPSYQHAETTQAEVQARSQGQQNEACA
jgi:hypothetical protein